MQFTAQPSAAASLKANLLPSAVAAFCLKAAAHSDELLLQAHAGSGIVRGHFPAPWPIERVHSVLQDLLAAATSGHGNLVLPHCPPAWKRTVPVWGARRNDAWLMKAVKDKLDPRYLFNPGRFAAGI